MFFSVLCIVTSMECAMTWLIQIMRQRQLPNNLYIWFGSTKSYQFKDINFFSHN